MWFPSAGGEVLHWTKPNMVQPWAQEVVRGKGEVGRDGLWK